MEKDKTLKMYWRIYLIIGIPVLTIGILIFISINTLPGLVDKIINGNISSDPFLVFNAKLGLVTPLYIVWLVIVIIELIQQGNQQKLEMGKARWLYFLTGVFISLSMTILAVATAYLFYYGIYSWELCVAYLPGGILAGYFGHLLDKRFAKSSRYRIGFFLLTIIMSFFLSWVSYITLSEFLW